MLLSIIRNTEEAVYEEAKKYSFKENEDKTNLSYDITVIQWII